VGLTNNLAAVLFSLVREGREIRSTLSLSLSLSDHLCFKQQEKAEREKPLVPSKPELELYLSPQKEIGRR
jgi:hypothetical protein